MKIDFGTLEGLEWDKGNLGHIRKHNVDYRECEEVFVNIPHSTEYIDWTKAVVNPAFPNLKLSTRSITIRIPESLLNSLKMLANKKDVPYQSLVKIFLDEKIREETGITK